MKGNHRRPQNAQRRPQNPTVVNVKRTYIVFGVEDAKTTEALAAYLSQQIAQLDDLIAAIDAGQQIRGRIVIDYLD